MANSLPWTIASWVDTLLHFQSNDVIMTHHDVIAGVDEPELALDLLTKGILQRVAVKDYSQGAAVVSRKNFQRKFMMTSLTPLSFCIAKRGIPYDFVDWYCERIDSVKLSARRLHHHQGQRHQYVPRGKQRAKENDSFPFLPLFL